MKNLFRVLVSLILALSVIMLQACGEVKGKVGIRYYADGSAIVKAMLSNEETIGLVPEPAASNLIKKANAQGRTLYKLDLQELYDVQAKAYPQAVLMVKKSVLASYGAIVNAMADKIQTNVSWVKTNATDAVSAIASKFAGTTLNAGALSATAVDGCKIYWQSAVDAKEQVQAYLNDITSIEINSAKAVSDDFFYTGSVVGSSNKTTLTVYAPDGAPALSIAKFIYDNENFGSSLSFEYNVIKAVTVSTIYKDGKADMFIMPINVASKFYNTDNNSADPYVMVAVITHGNFYIISTEQISVEQLNDKTVAVPNMGAVPDWTFRSMLKKHNLESYNVEG